MNLSTAANIAEILGALTIIGGAIFAIVQLREYRALRHQAAAVEICHAFHKPDLVRAVTLILELPDELPAQQLRAHGKEYERAAITICLTYESIALMVYKEMASMSMVRELTGGLAVVLWRKLSPWIQTVRDENNQPSFSEWYQWLAEQLTEHSKTVATKPAYERYAKSKS